MSRFVVRKITQTEFDLAYQIRVQVFVQEQGIAVEEELDDLDPVCTHFILMDTLDQKVVGTCRLVPQDSTECHLGRMCILKEYRNQGLAKLLCDHFDVEARHQNYKIVTIHAQCSAQQFYEKVGYKPTNDPLFMEAGIEHLFMIKHL